jgi:uncharacterized protein YbbK (DUF523 family)
MGRASFFRGKIKKAKYRVQGLLTPRGRVCFEKQRKELARLVRIKNPSDADVIEALARGQDETLDYAMKRSATA